MFYWRFGRQSSGDGPPQQRSLWVFSSATDWSTELNTLVAPRCAPHIPYTGGTPSDPKLDPRTDVGPYCCIGQSQAAWRLPFTMRILPAIILGVGMLFFPESHRYFLMRDYEEKDLAALTKIRRAQPDADELRREFLAIKAEVHFDESFAKDRYPGKTAVILWLSQYSSLVNRRAAFHRVAVGCCTMFSQQLMGCNAMEAPLPRVQHVYTRECLPP